MEWPEPFHDGSNLREKWNKIYYPKTFMIGKILVVAVIIINIHYITNLHSIQLIIMLNLRLYVCIVIIYGMHIHVHICILWFWGVLNFFPLEIARSWPWFKLGFVSLDFLGKLLTLIIIQWNCHCLGGYRWPQLGYMYFLSFS